MLQYERALEYRRNGLEILPLVPGSKKPLIRWKDRPPLTDIDIKNYFSDNENNIGIFCGPKSANLLVIDFDSSRAWDEYRRDFEHITSRTLATRTRRGRHIFTRTPEPLIRNPFEPLKEIDIKLSGYVVAPESMVGSFQYEFFSDAEIYRLQSLTELPFKLRLEQGRQIPYSGTAKPYGLPWHLFNTLKGKTERYKSRSHAEQALITYCAAQSWNFDQVLTLFLIHANPDTHFRQHREPAKYLFSSYQNATAYLANNRRDIDVKIEELHKWALFQKWPKITGEYDRAIYSALVQIAKRSGKIEIGTSTREIAEMTGIDARTVRKTFRNRRDIFSPFLQ